MVVGRDTSWPLLKDGGVVIHMPLAVGSGTVIEQLSVTVATKCQRMLCLGKISN